MPSQQLGSLLQCGVVSDIQDDVSDFEGGSASLESSIRRLNTVTITGRGGTPVYHRCHLNDCELLQPVGRWKYRFSNKNVSFSPSKFAQTELRVGSVVVDFFRRHHVVTLYNYYKDKSSMTVTIAEVGANQLAVIAYLFPISREVCRAAGLVEPGDSASLEHVVHVLEETSVLTRFMFCSVGIPSTLMSEMLFTNIVRLPAAPR
jgi:hypothetical protein